jgi:hypothetical protein
MTRAIDALFSAPAAAAAAVTAHARATQAWLASSAAERPHHWRAVEAAWRTVKQLGVADQAQRAAVTLIQQNGKLRSTR